MKRWLGPFLRLQGKLTISYMLTSVLTFFLIEFILVSIVFTTVTLNLNAILLSQIQKDAPLASTYFVHGQPDSKAAKAWLQLIRKDLESQDPYHSQILAFSIVTPQGETISSVGPEALTAGTPIQPQLTPQNRQHLTSVFEPDQKGTVADDTSGTIVVITPISDSNKQIEGALVLKLLHPTVSILIGNFLELFLFSGVFITLLTALTGMIFGYLTARGLTRRLSRLTEASQQWSSGDFSVQALDTSSDEIGQVTQHFNQMARQLHTLLQTRQKLATLEERNRLARDLHDSVKQQIFAAAMQLRAAKLLLRRDLDAAELRLQDSDKLIRQAQQELATLIRELRPVALEGKTFRLALHELCTQWAQQTNIVANVEANELNTLPLSIEEALFRIAQEALANVARHGQATLVQISLTMQERLITIKITDNGQGFDTRQQPRGVGLQSMQERMQAFGGDVRIESAPGNGTSVIAYCPLLGIASTEAREQSEITHTSINSNSSQTSRKTSF